MAEIITLPAGNGAASSSTQLPCDTEANPVRIFQNPETGCVLVRPRPNMATRLRRDVAANYIPAKAELVRLPGSFVLVRHALSGEAVWTRAEQGAVGPLYRKLGRRS